MRSTRLVQVAVSDKGKFCDWSVSFAVVRTSTSQPLENISSAYEHLQAVTVLLSEFLRAMFS